MKLVSLNICLSKRIFSVTSQLMSVSSLCHSQKTTGFRRLHESLTSQMGKSISSVYAASCLTGAEPLQLSLGFPNSDVAHITANSTRLLILGYADIYEVPRILLAVIIMEYHHKEIVEARELLDYRALNSTQYPVAI